MKAPRITVEVTITIGFDGSQDDINIAAVQMAQDNDESVVVDRVIGSTVENSVGYLAAHYVKAGLAELNADIVLVGDGTRNPTWGARELT